MKSILIIDDDRELILEMEEILTEEGFIIEKTYDPLVGKNMMLAKLYDIVLLDYKMPGMNGLDLLGSITQQKTKPAIILITGSLNMEKLIEDAGCDSLVKAVFTKPFDIDELIAALKKI